MINPLTGVPTVAALAMLVDHIGGLVNHHRRGPGEWTVSSELSLELAPNALAQLASAPEVPVIGTGRPCWRNDPNALGLCEFTQRDSVVVTATVRSFHIQPPGHLAPFPDGPTGPLQPGSLADRMAVRVAERRCGEGPRTGPGPGAQQQPSRRARQGVREAPELVGSAAVNENRDDRPFNTASLRVNFLRRFRSGPESRCVGTPLRVGRSSTVGEARAIGGDGEVAIIARLTAYLG